VVSFEDQGNAVDLERGFLLVWEVEVFCSFLYFPFAIEMLVEVRDGLQFFEFWEARSERDCRDRRDRREDSESHVGEGLQEGRRLLHELRI